jgi:methylphosphotriester-DNA--protein-cysteine methyltransferase
VRSKNPDLWKEHTSIVNRLIDLIDERLETDLTLESIASEVAVSPYHAISVIGITLNWTSTLIGVLLP